MTFPETRYMGSKQTILPFILKHIEKLDYHSALDAFSGSACVSHALKRTGAQVYSNDMLSFAYHLARATIENNSVQLTVEDVRALLRPNPTTQPFIEKTFASLYFSDEDNRFLDNLWANIQELGKGIRRSIAIAAACRAAMKKRPRGIFTFVGRKKGWDGRRDLKMTMEQQFVLAVESLNRAVFSNSKANRATNSDVFELDPRGIDLVYIDPPYISQYSDCDYTRRYHFVEGFCSYWKDIQIQKHTVTKKFPSYPTAFSKRTGAEESFRRLFDHFRESTLVVSYSSNGIPWRDELTRLLKDVKKNVRVYETPHRYSFGTHGHKVNDNNNLVREYLFVAS
jgi:DNA adenine methylase